MQLHNRSMHANTEGMTLGRIAERFPSIRDANGALVYLQVKTTPLNARPPERFDWLDKLPFDVLGKFGEWFRRKPSCVGEVSDSIQPDDTHAALVALAELLGRIAASRFLAADQKDSANVASVA